MLKGINPALNAEVLCALRAMGHGDDLVIADANFPAASLAPRTALGELLRIDLNAPAAVRAVLSVYPIDTFTDDAAARMAVVDDPDEVLPVHAEVQDIVDAAHGAPLPLLAIERFSFYNRAQDAFAVIQTGERRFYGNFAFRKGVIAPDT